MRLVKDDFEIAQLQLAVDYTVKGFEDVVRALPAAEGRGERVIEGIFHLRARVEGNDVGYDTIAASGSNATVLHWMRNTGAVRRGDLLLLDAGVECHNLYTADVTRTMPISGTFSPAQRRIYELVARRPTGRHRRGEARRELQGAARSGDEGPRRRSLRTRHLGGRARGGAAPGPPAAPALHACTARATCSDSTSTTAPTPATRCTATAYSHEGYVLTVEPGLYFQPNDLTVPEEYRGIGVRIEDDVLVTATGSRNLSAALPRDPDDIEAWMAELWKRGGPTSVCSGA